MRGIRFSWKGPFLSILLLITFAGCGGSGGNDTTDFAGTVALNGGQFGTLNLTVQTLVASAPRFSIIRLAMAQTTDTVPANGSCVLPDQPPIPLSGTFMPSTNAINVSGNDSKGNTYVFGGTANPSNGGMSGTIQNASGTPIGGFSAVVSNPGTPAAAYCGNYAEGGGTPGTGVFNVQIDSNNNLTGSAQDNDPNKSGVAFIGKVNGNTFTACSNDPNGSQPICGTIQNDQVTGFFQSGSGSTGCFVGNTSACTSGTASTCDPATLPTCSFGTCP